MKRRAKKRLGTPPHPLYPEPGAWVLGKTRGLPEIDPPKPLPKGKLQTHEVAEHIAYEGLGFCVRDLISSEKIADKALAELWGNAKVALQCIIEYIDEAPAPDLIRKKRSLRRLRQE